MSISLFCSYAVSNYRQMPYLYESPGKFQLYATTILAMLLSSLPGFVLFILYFRLLKKPPEERKRLKIILLIYSLCTGIGTIILLVITGTYLYILGFVLSSVSFVGWRKISVSQQTLSLPSSPEAFRTHLHVRYITEVHFWFTSHDAHRILRFDHKRSRGETAAVPKMWTYEGTQLWQHYVAICMNDPVMTETEHKQQMMSSGGWRCTCGKTNPVYTSTCVCGKNKRDVPLDVQTYQPPTPQKWRCPCGRENASYTSTCVCGKSKREAETIS